MPKPINIKHQDHIRIAAIWGLLLLTVALAAFVVHIKNGLWRVDLADPQTFGSVQMRTPANWQVEYDRQGSTEQIEAAEASSPYRRLSVQVFDADENGSLLDMLNEGASFQMLNIDPEDARQVEHVEVADGAGYIIHPRMGNSFAILGFTNGRIALLRMHSNSRPSAADDAIIYDVTKSLRLQELPPQPHKSRANLRSREI